MDSFILYQVFNLHKTIKYNINFTYNDTKELVSFHTTIYNLFNIQKWIITEVFSVDECIIATLLYNNIIHNSKALIRLMNYEYVFRHLNDINHVITYNNIIQSYDPYKHGLYIIFDEEYQKYRSIPSSMLYAKYTTSWFVPSETMTCYNEDTPIEYDDTCDTFVLAYGTLDKFICVQPSEIVDIVKKYSPSLSMLSKNIKDINKDISYDHMDSVDGWQQLIRLLKTLIYVGENKDNGFSNDVLVYNEYNFSISYDSIDDIVNGISNVIDIINRSIINKNVSNSGDNIGITNNNNIYNNDVIANTDFNYINGVNDNSTNFNNSTNNNNNMNNITNTIINNNNNNNINTKHLRKPCLRNTNNIDSQYLNSTIQLFNNYIRKSVLSNPYNNSFSHSSQQQIQQFGILITEMGLYMRGWRGDYNDLPDRWTKTLRNNNFTLLNNHVTNIHKFLDNIQSNVRREFLSLELSDITGNVVVNDNNFIRGLSNTEAITINHVFTDLNPNTCSKQLSNSILSTGVFIYHYATDDMIVDLNDFDIAAHSAQDLNMTDDEVELRIQTEDNMDENDKLFTLDFDVQMLYNAYDVMTLLLSICPLTVDIPENIKLALSAGEIVSSFSTAMNTNYYSLLTHMIYTGEIRHYLLKCYIYRYNRIITNISKNVDTSSQNSIDKVSSIDNVDNTYNSDNENNIDNTSIFNNINNISNINIINNIDTFNNPNDTDTTTNIDNINTNMRNSIDNVSISNTHNNTKHTTMKTIYNFYNEDLQRLESLLNIDNNYDIQEYINGMRKLIKSFHFNEYNYLNAELMSSLIEFHPDSLNTLMPYNDYNEIIYNNQLINYEDKVFNDDDTFRLNYNNNIVMCNTYSNKYKNYTNIKHYYHPTGAGWWKFNVKTIYVNFKPTFISDTNSCIIRLPSLLLNQYINLESSIFNGIKNITIYGHGYENVHLVNADISYNITCIDIQKSHCYVSRVQNKCKIKHKTTNQLDYTINANVICYYLDSIYNIKPNSVTNWVFNEHIFDDESKPTTAYNEIIKRHQKYILQPIIVKCKCRIIKINGKRYACVRFNEYNNYVNMSNARINGKNYIVV